MNMNARIGILVDYRRQFEQYKNKYAFNHTRKNLIQRFFSAQDKIL